MPHIIIPGQRFESVLSVVYLGQLIDADADPTIRIWKGAIATSILVTVSRIDTGKYAYRWDVPTAWEDGARISLEVNYSVFNQVRNSGNQLLGSVDSSTFTPTPTPTPTPTDPSIDLNANIAYCNRLQAKLQLSGCECNYPNVGDTVRLNVLIWDVINKKPYNLDDGISVFKIWVINESGAEKTLTYGIDPAIVSNNDGTYYLEYSWSEAGTHKWGIKISGTLAITETQKIYVSPNPL